VTREAAVFYIAVLPPFVNPAQYVLHQTVAMSIAYVVVATLIRVFIVSVADTARKQLQDTVTMSALRRVLSLAVLAIAAWLAWSTRLVSSS
jgi:threonine/homoserine/homoserine lactone efflux protein